MDMEDFNLNQPANRPNQEDDFDLPVSSETGTGHHDLEAHLEDRIFAALSYMSILFIVPLILKNEEDDIYFHARQGMVLFAAEVIVWFVLYMLDTFMVAIAPNVELPIVRILGAVGWVVFMGLSLAGIYYAAKGKRWNMPFLGRIARKLSV